MQEMYEIQMCKYFNETSRLCHGWRLREEHRWIVLTSPLLRLASTRGTHPGCRNEPCNIGLREIPHAIFPTVPARSSSTRHVARFFAPNVYDRGAQVCITGAIPKGRATAHHFLQANALLSAPGVCAHQPCGGWWTRWATGMSHLQRFPRRPTIPRHLWLINA